MPKTAGFVGSLGGAQLPWRGRRSSTCSEAREPTRFTRPVTPTHGTTLSNVEGEWFGHETSFSGVSGERLTIPEYYVPDEFRNWDAKIYGFDCVTSVKEVEGNSLRVKLTRAMPTVGCEADAVVPEVFEETLPLSQDDGFVGFENGSFSRGPPKYASSSTWEHCMCYGKKRVRVLFPELDGRQKTRLFTEAWDGDYCNGALLSGCGSKISRIEGNGEMDASVQLEGKWSRRGYTWRKSDGTCQVSSVIESRNRFVKRFLPGGVTIDKVVDENGRIVLETSWNVSELTRIVLLRTYSETQELEEVSNYVDERC
ncbi:hypothetical protein NDN08_000118 [Rhodosorus marinus]|uniref:Uncharacterized protein n=1 Tax=Rhodosorus marinus TaxID=101924 RepID=A0AAV8UFN0_9RHOD|nr:hypothetical protein NDN08_000118 [Rhodosorus marinus]